MKLNRKGYLTVEVILASVAAIGIAFFLMEITIKLVNLTDDAFVDTELLTDKALIMENIKAQLEKDIEQYGGISSISLYGDNPDNVVYEIIFCFLFNQDDDRNIRIDKNSGKLEYTGNIVAGGNDDVVLYSKVLNKNLSNINIISSQTGNISSSGYISFIINADNKFSKDKFEANIIVYNDKKC